VRYAENATHGRTSDASARPVELVAASDIRSDHASIGLSEAKLHNRELAMVYRDYQFSSLGREPSRNPGLHVAWTRYR
jgi:hypothetical protein